MADILAYLLYLVLLLVFLLLPGWLAVALLFRRQAETVPPLFIWAVLGLLFWSLTAFVLCSALLLSRPPVLLILFFLAASTAVLLAIRRKTLWPPPPWRPQRPPLESLLIGIPLLIVVVFLFFKCLNPEVIVDENTYHLKIPQLYIAAHGFRPIAFDVYSIWPHGMELVFAVAMLFKGVQLAKLVHFAIGVLTLAALYRFGRSRGSAFAGLLAGVIFLSNSIVFYEFSLAYVDITFAFVLLLGFWLLFVYFESGMEQPRLILLAGLCAGLLSGVKLSAWSAVFLLGLYYLAQAVRRPKIGLSLRRLLLYFALPCVLLAIPWWRHAYRYTGNPVYPLLYKFLGGVRWNEQLSAEFRAWHHSMGMGHRWIDYLLLPWRMIMESGPHYQNFSGRISHAWLLWLPLALSGLRRNRLVRHCLFLAGGYFVFWALSSQQLRFIIPILPLLSLAAGLSAAEWLKAIPLLPWRKVVALAIAAAAVVTLAVESGPWVRRGLIAANRLVRTGEAGWRPPVEPVFRFINAELPAHTHLMFVNENKGYYCARDYIADSFFEASMLSELVKKAQSTAELENLLRSLCITHVLMETSHDWGVRYPAVLLDLLHDPARMRPIDVGGRYQLYELAAPSASPTCANRYLDWSGRPPP